MLIESPRQRDSGAEVDELAEQVFADPNDVGASRRRVVLAGCTVALLGVAMVDFWIGFEVSFSLFYLFPVAVAAWYGGRAMGLAFAIIGAALWAVSDQLSGHVYEHRAVPYWNAGVRLAYFVIVAELVGRLQQLLARERRASETDPLTGVFNRTGWFEAAEVELARARRESQPIALAYIDLDDFKRVNDTRGHEEGDRVLQRVAELLRQNLRRSDVVARLGGDEFAIFFTNVGPDAAKRICDKLHRTLTEEMHAHSWPVGFSIGVASFEEPPGSVRDIVIKADAAMYAAKRAGKNAVRLAG